MPRKLESLDVGGYDQDIKVDDSDLDKVVALLELTDDEQIAAARERILEALVDLESVRARTFNAKRVREDRKDLRKLAKAADSERLAALTGRMIDTLESLRTENPVLYRRLNLCLPEKPLQKWIKRLGEAQDTILGIGQEIQIAAAALSKEFDAEKNPGQRFDRAGRAFAQDLLFIWQEFSGKGTSRQPARGSDPFGDFVRAAGKLVDPDFNGRRFAREAHEEFGQRRGGAKRLK
jgi:hypothetical protein